MNKTIIAVDVETTGLNVEKAQMIEIGAAIFKDGEINAVFNELIHPISVLPQKITELTGITEEMLRGKEPESKVMQSFLTFIKEHVGEEYIILGHNVIFDYGFLKTAAQRLGASFECKGIDTLKIARSLHPELKSKTLGAMCDWYQISQERSHRALDDAMAAMQLYACMYDKFHDKNPEVFMEEALLFSPKKQEPATAKQLRFLLDLCKFHDLLVPAEYEKLTKSNASRLIDSIILKHGMPNRRG